MGVIRNTLQYFVFKYILKGRLLLSLLTNLIIFRNYSAPCTGHNDVVETDADGQDMADVDTTHSDLVQRGSTASSAVLIPSMTLKTRLEGPTEPEFHEFNDSPQQSYEFHTGGDHSGIGQSLVGFVGEDDAEDQRKRNFLKGYHRRFC